MMHGPEYVLQKAQIRYRSIWRDALLGTDSGAYTMALVPPSASAITARAADVSAWLIRWRQWATQHPGVTLRKSTIRTKFGDQPIYTHLDIPDTLALASLNADTAAHWQRARDRWDQLSRHHPGQAVQPWLARIVDLDDYDFTTLLAATAWFRANPRSGLTVRSVAGLLGHLGNGRQRPARWRTVPARPGGLWQQESVLSSSTFTVGAPPAPHQPLSITPEVRKQPWPRRHAQSAWRGQAGSGIGGAGLRREAAAAGRSRRPGLAAPPPGRCRRSR